MIRRTWSTRCTRRRAQHVRSAAAGRNGRLVTQRTAEVPCPEAMCTADRISKEAAHLLRCLDTVLNFRLPLDVPLNFLEPVLSRSSWV